MRLFLLGKTTEFALDESRLLQSVEVPVLTDFNCQYRYFSLWNLILGSKVDSKSMFCAGLAEGGKDSCQVCVASLPLTFDSTEFSSIEN